MINVFDVGASNISPRLIYDQVTYSKIKSIYNYNGITNWEYIESVQIKEYNEYYGKLDPLNNSWWNESQILEWDSTSDTNRVHSKIINLTRNTKYIVKVNIECMDEVDRYLYMLQNFSNMTELDYSISNKKHPYGNILNNPVLNWSLTNDYVPNLSIKLPRGRSNWVFSFTVPDIYGAYVFGFGCSNKKIDELVNTGGYKDILGNRILATGFVSNRESKLVSDNLVSYYRKKDHIILTNSELLEINMTR